MKFAKYSLHRGKGLVLVSHAVLSSPLMGLFVLVLHCLDRDFALRLLESRAYWTYQKGTGSEWEIFVNHLFTLYPTFPTFSHAHHLLFLPHPHFSFFFSFWFISPWSLLFPGNEQLRSGLGFFLSTKLCHVSRQTATNKDKYLLEGLDALQDFQLGYPASLLCLCLHCPGVDRRGERKKTVRRWREGWGRETNTKCSIEKRQNKFSHSYAFSFLHRQYKMYQP